MPEMMKPALPALCAELRIRFDGDVALVNSRDVARKFEKQHKNVLRSIELLVEEGGMLRSEHTAWFREVWETNSQNDQDYRSFDLTRDGLMLLVMGWTGPRALRIKVRYIEAFNAMEDAIRAQHDGITQIDKVLSDMMESQVNAIKALQKVEYKVDSFAANYKPPRLDIKSIVKDEHIDAVYQMGGYCPCCGRAKVLTEDGKKSPFAEFDHFFQNSQRNAEHTWLICKPCHAELTTGKVSRSDRQAEFTAYQNKRLRLPGKQPRLF